MKTVFSKIQFMIFVCVCSIIILSCGHRSVNNTHIPWDSVPLIQEQKGFSLPPSLVTVDLEKDYPTLNLKIELKERKFIPLETTPKIHLDKDRTIKYLSEKICVIINEKRGDVFIFNLDGKCVGNFNHRGPGPIDYQIISDIVVDENAEEIFIHTHQRGVILIYTFEGNYLRKLYNPVTTHANRIINFNNTLLLANGSPRDRKAMLPKNHFIFLSKQTGAIIDSLYIGTPERQATLKGDYYISTPNIIKNGKDIYISEISSDTLYHIEQNGRLKPFLVRTPSVFGKNPQMFFQIGSKLGSYLLLNKTVNKIDPNAPEYQRFKNESYILNLETGDIYKAGVMKFSDNFEDDISIGFDNLNPFDVSANTLTTFVDADILMDELKRGNVKSDELKKMVSALNEEDNPVLVIFKF